jgi:RNA polymerase sigma-70 factor (ECF subfamily)
VYTWLYRIAVNTALSHRRSPVVRSLSFSDGVDPDRYNTRTEIEDVTPETCDLVSRREVQERIQEAILSLDGDLRSVVVLRDVEGLGYSEIAKVLCLPEGTVKSRLHRGRLILRDRLLDIIHVEEKK